MRDGVRGRRLRRARARRSRPSATRPQFRRSRRPASPVNQKIAAAATAPATMVIELRSHERRRRARGDRADDPRGPAGDERPREEVETERRPGIRERLDEQHRRVGKSRDQSPRPLPRTAPSASRPACARARRWERRRPSWLRRRSPSRRRKPGRVVEPPRGSDEVEESESNPYGTVRHASVPSTPRRSRAALLELVAVQPRREASPRLPAVERHSQR